MPNPIKKALKNKPNITVPYSEGSDVLGFYDSWINSTEYKSRLNKNKYKNPDKVIDDRLKNLNRLNINIGNVRSEARPGTGHIDINIEDAKKYGKDTVKSHEISHLIGASPSGIYNTSFNKKEEDRFRDLNINPSSDIHDRLPFEMKGDLDSNRFNMFKGGIYDVREGQPFTKDHLEKSRETLKDDIPFNRLIDQVGDDNYIELMNTIASNKSKSLSVAKYGGMVKVKNRYNIPQYGLGAFLKSAEGSYGAISTVGAGIAGLSTAGEPNGFKSFIGGAGSGAALGSQLGSIVPGIGTVIGAVGGGIIGGVLGLSKGKKDKRELEKQKLLEEKRLEENEDRAEMQRSKGVLNNYPTQGVQGVNIFGKTYAKGGTVKSKKLSIPNYALGGSPDYLAEGDEVIEYDQSNPPMTYGNGEVNQLSSSLGSINGESHNGENGGVAMSGGEKIYSDRLKPSKELKEYLKSEKIKSNGSYADIIERVGKKEGKNEKALFSEDRFEKIRAEKMNEKYSLAKELIFADQEANKPIDKEEIVDFTNTQEEFSYGGELPKKGFGAEFTKGLNKAYVSGANKVSNSFNNVSQSLPSEGMGKFGSILGSVGGFLNKNMDMIASGANYALNNRAIEQMPLTQETRMFNPAYLDTTREDGYQQDRIQSQTRQGLRASTAGSSQTRNAVIGDLVSRATNSSNQVSDAENKRLTQVKNYNISTANNAGMYNTQLANQTYGDYQSNRMLQLSEKVKNRNNLTQSILGNLQVRKMNEMDQERLRLIAERDKERGIIGRSETYTNFLDSYLNK